MVGPVHRCPGGSGAPAYLGARPRRVRRQDGDRGVSTGATARSWSAVQREGRQQQGCRELTAGSSVVRARRAGPESVRSGGVRLGGGGEDLVVEVAQCVMAAAGELSGHGQQRQLSVQTGLDLLEVGVVGRAGPSGVDRGLIQCPAYSAQRSIGGPWR